MVNGETRDSTDCSAASCDARLSTTTSESTWNATAGRYETVTLTVEATDSEGTTATATVETPVYIAGGANGDGQANIFDAVTIGRNWQSTAG